MMLTRPVFNRRMISANEVCAISVNTVSSAIERSPIQHTVTGRKVVSDEIHAILIDSSYLFWAMSQRSRQSLFLSLLFQPVLSLGMFSLPSLIPQSLTDIQTVRETAHDRQHTPRDRGMRHVDYSPQCSVGREEQRGGEDEQRR